MRCALGALDRVLDRRDSGAIVMFDSGCCWKGAERVPGEVLGDHCVFGDLGECLADHLFVVGEIED